MDALRKLEEGMGFATVELIGKLAARLGVEAGEWLPASETFPTLAPVRMEIGQGYYLRETYRQILDQVSAQELDPELPQEARRKLLLIKVDALVRMERVEETLPILLEAVESCVGRRSPEDNVYAAKLHHRLGELYLSQSRVGRMPLEEAQMESYLAYMRGYLLVDKLQHSEAAGLADQLAEGLGRVADDMGGAQQMADRLFEMSSTSAERDPRMAFNYLTQAKALYRSLNRRQMHTQIVEAMNEVRRRQANPEAVLQELLREVRLDALSDDDRIRLINSYSNAAEHCLKKQRYEETSKHLQRAAELLTAEIPSMFITRTYYTTQATFMIIREQYEESVEHAMTAYEKALEMHSPEEAAAALKIAADAYKRQGKLGQAADLLRQASDLLAGDSLPEYEPGTLL
ncbi:hypothetical protein [Tumebacillus permanentifrigoris]|uniref:hypothetical protein n=1 Tax=Tumebacillus permanentifrigoris TaxID=378543 RepID=UPI0011B240E7|nr:hypothetical protein [Tumebacillus permanentifrigoris]